MSLILTHARYQLLETIRIPIAVIGSMFFPAASMLFFVVPFTGNDPAAATLATASMVTFAVMSANIFQYGIGVAEDRQQPWDPYTRTLPAGPLPRFAGRILAGLALTLFSLLPVVLIAAVGTRATVSVGGFLTALAVLPLVAAPFTLMGLAIGYALPSKAAIVVAQVVFFPLAVGGGLLFPPGAMPGFMAAISPFLPTRGAVELMWAAVGSVPVNRLAVAALLAWVVALTVVAAWAYRRDEGRRFS